MSLSSCGWVLIRSGQFKITPSEVVPSFPFSPSLPAPPPPSSPLHPSPPSPLSPGQPAPLIIDDVLALRLTEEALCQVGPVNPKGVFFLGASVLLREIEVACAALPPAPGRSLAPTVCKADPSAVRCTRTWVCTCPGAVPAEDCVTPQQGTWWSPARFWTNRRPIGACVAIVPGRDKRHDHEDSCGVHHRILGGRGGESGHSWLAKGALGDTRSVFQEPGA